MIIKLENIITEGSFVVPAGSYITRILQNVKLGEIEGGIKYGTQHGGNDVVGANNLARLDNAWPIFSMDEDTVIYFDAVDDWNGAVADIFIVLDSVV